MLTTRDVYGCQRVARGLLLVGVVAFSLLAQVNSVSAQVDLDFPDSSGENRAQSESISELQDRFDALSRSHKQLQSRLERVEAGQSTQSGLDSTEVKPAALQEWEDLDDVSPNPSGLPQITVDDGLSIHGPDDWYTFSFHTLIQAQYTEIVGQPANSPGGFTVPRQRLYFAGDVLGTVSHYTMLQWAYGNYNLLDTYIDLKLAPTVNLRFGHWRSPFLYEMSILPEDKLISTERSVANNTVIPERQTGVALFGSLWEGGVDYQFGVFNGPNHQVPDTNSAKDVIGLVDLKPFHFAPDDHPFKYLHFVGSLDYGRQNQSPPPVIQYRLNSELDNFGVSDGANQVSPPWLTFAPKSGTNGERFLWGFETVWLYNGWTALGGMIGGHQVFSNPTGKLVTAPVSGHQISLTRFLTGERPTTRAEIRPLRNFNLRDPVGNPGAIELFGRFARLDVGRQLIDEQVAIPATSTSNVDLLDAGAIWYLNQYTAAWFAWQHSWLGTPVETAPGRTTSGYELFTMRLQFFF